MDLWKYSALLGRVDIDEEMIFSFLVSLSSENDDDDDDDDDEDILDDWLLIAHAECEERSDDNCLFEDDKRSLEWDRYSHVVDVIYEIKNLNILISCSLIMIIKKKSRW